MNVLTNELIFPDPSMADADGVVAVGGDLSVERLFFKNFLNFDKNNNKFVNVWLDFRLCSYAYFREKNFFFLKKKLTVYDQSLPNNQSKKYSFLSFTWIKRRYYSHLYINHLLNEKFFFSFDFFITKVICRFFL